MLNLGSEIGWGVEGFIGKRGEKSIVAAPMAASRWMLSFLLRGDGMGKGKM